jgi:hypothetical protein
VASPNLHFAYNFDTVNFNNAVTGTLPVNQPDKINTLQIEFTERTSNPNLSISVDRVTSLFSFKNGHLSTVYPNSGSQDKAFVIEGFHIKNVNTEKILVFLPLTKSANDTVFTPLEKALASKEPTAIDLNTYIPKKEKYMYYKHVDRDGTIFHIVYFDKSSLYYAGLEDLPVNTYPTTPSKKDVFISEDVAVRRTAVNPSFEDNIYIDCVPVEIASKPKEKFLSFTKMNQCRIMPSRCN